MSRSSTRAAAAAVLAMVVGGLTAVTSAPTASGQSGGVVALAPTGAESGSTFSQGNPGTATEATSSQTNDGVGGESAGGGSAESVIGADGRVRVNPTTGYPARALGQIEYTQGLPPLNAFICTGFLIDVNTILAAGHCAYTPTAGGGDPVESPVFFPGRNGGTNPFGSCPIEGIFAPVEWRVNGSEYADYSVMNLGDSCNGIGNTVGWFGMQTYPLQHALDNVMVTIPGYPGDKPFGTQWRMSGRIQVSRKKMVFYSIDTFAGQSGSPVWRNIPSGSGCTGVCAVAIHAYGNAHGSGPHQTYNHAPRLTGPRFNLILDIAAQNDP